MTSSTPVIQQRRRFSSIQVIFFAGILGVVTLALGLVTGSQTVVVRQELVAEMQNRLQQQAATNSLIAGDLLVTQLQSLHVLSISEALQNPVEEQNQRYSGADASIQQQIAERDQQWRSPTRPPSLLAGVMQHPLVVELDEYQTIFPDHIEILVTDRYGALVGASAPAPPDIYAQVSEQWWQTAWNNGSGGIYIGEPEYDSSSQTEAVKIAVPIRLHGGDEVIGILRTTYHIRGLDRLLTSFNRSGAQSFLWFPNGTVFAAGAPGPVPVNTVLPDITSASNTVFTAVHNGVASFITWTSLQSTQNNPAVGGLGWRLVVVQDQTSVLRPVTAALGFTWIVALIALVVAAGVALMLSHRTTRPLRALREAAQAIADGDLDRQIVISRKDEIGDLSVSLNQMAQTLTSNLQSQQRDYQALQEANQEFQRLLGLVQDLETPVIPIVKGVVLVPLVGYLDAHRFEALTRVILAAVHQQSIKRVIVDLTGITMIDTASAKHLEELIRTIKLLGAGVELTGIHASIAETMVALGIRLPVQRITSDLTTAIEALMSGQSSSTIPLTK